MVAFSPVIVLLLFLLHFSRAQSGVGSIIRPVRITRGGKELRLNAPTVLSGVGDTVVGTPLVLFCFILIIIMLVQLTLVPWLPG